MERLLASDRFDGMCAEVGLDHEALYSGLQFDSSSVSADVAYAYRGHTGHIFSLQARKGASHYFYSGSNDNSIRGWRVEDEHFDTMLLGHGGRVSALSLISADPGHSELLVSGAWDGSVKVWDCETNKMVGDVHTSFPIVTHVCTLPNRFTSHGGDVDNSNVDILPTNERTSAGNRICVSSEESVTIYVYDLEYQGSSSLYSTSSSSLSAKTKCVQQTSSLSGAVRCVAPIYHFDGIVYGTQRGKVCMIDFRESTSSVESSPFPSSSSSSSTCSPSPPSADTFQFGSSSRPAYGFLSKPSYASTQPSSTLKYSWLMDSSSTANSSSSSSSASSSVASPSFTTKAISSNSSSIVSGGKLHQVVPLSTLITCAVDCCCVIQEANALLVGTAEGKLYRYDFRIYFTSNGRLMKNFQSSEFQNNNQVVSELKGLTSHMVGLQSWKSGPQKKILIVAGDARGSVCIWDLESTTCLRVFHRPGLHVRCVEVNYSIKSPSKCVQEVEGEREDKRKDTNEQQHTRRCPQLLVGYDDDSRIYAWDISDL